MRALPFVAVALLAAGCTSSEGGLGFGAGTLPPEPYYKDYRELLAGEHHKDFPLPVEQQARAAIVTVVLQTRDQGLPLPGASPATLTVRILAPDGAILEEAQLDAQRTNASLALDDLAPGRYLARVDGFGVSQDLDGQAYGAEYLLTAEILYE